MPRLIASNICLKCKGPLAREPGLLGAVYSCKACDAVDPMAAAAGWLHGQLSAPLPPAEAPVKPD